MLQRLVNKCRSALRDCWPVLILAVFLWSNRFLIGYAGEIFPETKQAILALAGKTEGNAISDTTWLPVGMQKIAYDENLLTDATLIGVSGTAQSSYKVTKKGEYPAANCVDGDVNTCWQDGEEGFAEGSRLEFYFPETRTLRYIRIRNGRAVSDQKFYENGRAQNITVVAGGQSYSIVLDDVNAYELIEVTGGLEASAVHIVIDSVYAGSEWEDTCMTEVEFYE